MELYQCYFFLIGFLLFLIGIYGIFLTRKNIIIVLMSIELLLLSLNLLFITVSITLDDILGQALSLYILTIAASESAIGLALIVIYYRLRNLISVDFISTLKG